MVTAVPDPGSESMATVPPASWTAADIIPSPGCPPSAFAGADASLGPEWFSDWEPDPVPLSATVNRIPWKMGESRTVTSVACACLNVLLNATCADL